MSDVKPIPDGYTAVTPHLTIAGCSAAIEFYKKAFGAEEVVRMPGPGDSIMHAEISIGGARIMLGDAMPEAGFMDPKALGGSPSSVMIYTDDCDALFKRAVDAGATEAMPLQDQFWGDRYGRVVDPFGHSWAIATHIEDVSDEEMGKRLQAVAAEMMAQGSE